MPVELGSMSWAVTEYRPGSTRQGWGGSSESAHQVRGLFWGVENSRKDTHLSGGKERFILAHSLGVSICHGGKERGSRVAHVAAAARKQKKRELGKKPEQELDPEHTLLVASRQAPPLTLSPFNSAILLRLHQGTNGLALMGAESSGAHCFPQSHQVSATLNIPEPTEEIPCSNHNDLFFWCPEDS